MGASDTWIAALFGLVTGSFLTVCVYRLPLGISIVSPGSSCPRCQHPLAAWENIPVLGFLWLRGRCRSCHQKIAFRYPVLEALTGCAFAYSYWRFGPSTLFLKNSFFLACMLVLTFTDIECRQLPDEVTLGGWVVGLATAFWTPPGWSDALLGSAAGSAILWLVGEVYKRWRNRQGMGLGDVKMMGLIGSFLGLRLTLVTLVLAAPAGAVAGVGMAAIMFAARRRRWRTRGLSAAESRARARESVSVYLGWKALPFGVFLSSMAVVASIWGTSLWNWYAALVNGR